MENRSIVRPALVSALVLVWILVIAAGTRTLMRYESAPGAAGRIARHWPTKSHVLRGQGKYTLVMLVHPNCPCTRASLAELEILNAKLHGKLTACVLFTKPAAIESEIRSSVLWVRASRIPGVSLQFDAGGSEAAQFGGLVSGQTIVYDPQGDLVFSGGITAARGQQGDNNGVDSVVLAVTGKLKDPAQTPVFGCSLGNPSEKDIREQSWKKS
jgi:hypothetical protein